MSGAAHDQPLAIFSDEPVRQFGAVKFFDAVKDREALRNAHPECLDKRMRDELLSGFASSGCTSPHEFVRQKTLGRRVFVVAIKAWGMHIRWNAIPNSRLRNCECTP
jgi:hypothetical protein